MTRTFLIAAATTLAAPAAAAVTDYRGPGAEIVDFQNRSSTIDVGDSFAVTDVDVLFTGLRHSLPREVQLYLEKDGISVALVLNRNVGRNDFGGDFAFDDEASQPISSWGGGSGTYRPETPLSAFDGLDAKGAWRIRTFDTGGGDAGGFTGWTLRLSDAAVAPVPEPATWAMMIGGFGLVGGAMRRRTTTAVTA